MLDYVDGWNANLLLLDGGGKSPPNVLALAKCVHCSDCSAGEARCEQILGGKNHGCVLKQRSVFKCLILDQQSALGERVRLHKGGLGASQCSGTTGVRTSIFGICKQLNILWCKARLFHSVQAQLVATSLFAASVFNNSYSNMVYCKSVA